MQELPVKMATKSENGDQKWIFFKVSERGYANRNFVKNINLTQIIYFVDLRHSGMLRSVDWQFCTEVPRKIIGLIFKGQLIDCSETSAYKYQYTLLEIRE
jgi:hypothetical protein